MSRHEQDRAGCPLIIPMTLVRINDGAFTLIVKISTWEFLVVLKYMANSSRKQRNEANKIHALQDSWGKVFAIILHELC